MKQHNYAVLIGIDKYRDKNLASLQYAEKDCRDLCRVLTDEENGIFTRANVHLLTGSKATTDEVKSVLKSKIVNDRSTTDMVLMYFAGHGFMHNLGDRKRTYLATFDSDIRKIAELPYEGLEMDFIHNEIFAATKARIALIILDCCHSGAIVPESLRDTSVRSESDGLLKRLRKGEMELLDGRLISGGGRVALVACSADANAREEEVLENGIFTHHLVRGLAGEAAEAISGEVTLDSLAGHLRYRLRDQEPVRYGQDVGRLVLAKGFKRGETVHWGPSDPAVEPQSLNHPLEECIDLINQLLQGVNVSGVQSHMNLQQRALRSIRVATQSYAAATLDWDHGKMQVLLSDVDASERCDMVTELVSAISPIAPRIFEEHFTRKMSHGVIFIKNSGKQDRRARLIVIPTTFEPGRDVLAILGIRRTVALSDALGVILSSFFHTARNLNRDQEHLLDHLFLDELKRTYGFLPYSLYRRRLNLFCNRLHSMTTYFQPIIFLRPGDPELDSWEVLARDPATAVAPFDLFNAAELWGRRFMRELDSFILRKVSEEAKIKHSHNNHSRPGWNKEISINVYPQTLMDDKYFEELGKVINEGLVTPERLALEISEKVPISTNDAAYGTEEAELFLFKSRLQEYVKQYNVTFAIDDFGVRHASVSRLARLNPAYVKIDRDVLLSDFPGLILKFVLELTRRGRLRPVKCVVEGFDGESQISLRKIYELGIRHVQGFKLEKPAPEPALISRDKLRFIANLLSEPALDDTLA